MNKLFGCALGAALCACMAFSAYAGQIKVRVNGALADFDGKGAVIQEGRTLIPLRGVFEELGYSVDWDAQTRTASLEGSLHSVSVAAQAPYLTVDGRQVQMDVPAAIIDGSMYIPLRAVGEAAGADVSWDGGTQTAYIDTANSSDEAYLSYLRGRAKIVSQLDCTDFSSKLYSVAGDGLREQCVEIKADALNMKNKLSLGAESLEKSLVVPQECRSMHSLTLQALEKQQEVCSLVIMLADGSISQTQAEERLDTLIGEAESLNKAVDDTF